FTLVAARNPCPCGYFGDNARPCSCSEGTVTKYQKRLSGPIMDRIDMHLKVQRLEFGELTGDQLGESSASVRARVTAARRTQWRRFAESPLVRCNADMRIGDVRAHCEL